MKHRGSFPNRMDAADRHSGQSDASLCLLSSFVRSSLRWSLSLSTRTALCPSPKLTSRVPSSQIYKWTAVYHVFRIRGFAQNLEGAVAIYVIQMPAETGLFFTFTRTWITCSEPADPWVWELGEGKGKASEKEGGMIGIGEGLKM